MNKLFVANWKLYLTTKESIDLSHDLDSLETEYDLVICPSSLSLPEVARTEHPYTLGGQDCFWEDSGAHTGAISVSDLKELGVEYVIVGHSERRAEFGETDEMVALKVSAVIDHGMTPIMCVGESKEEREKRVHEEKVREQVRIGLSRVKTEHRKNVVIAYEPIWAISKAGLGEPSTPDNASIMHEIIREETGVNSRVLYGGSVREDNFESFISHDSVDGVLVGSASTKLQSMQAMLK